jgi:aspartyl/asparaginyl-tRNA synthetase
VLDVIDAMFMHIFEGLATRCAAELAAINKQYPFEPFVAKPTRITFAEGIKLLQENGYGFGCVCFGLVVSARVSRCKQRICTLHTATKQHP